MVEETNPRLQRADETLSLTVSAPKPKPNALNANSGIERKVVKKKPKVATNIHGSIPAKTEVIEGIVSRNKFAIAAPNPKAEQAIAAGIITGSISAERLSAARSATMPKRSGKS